jgi:hypothetical protein
VLVGLADALAVAVAEEVAVGVAVATAVAVGVNEGEGVAVGDGGRPPSPAQPAVKRNGTAINQTSSNLRIAASYIRKAYLATNRPA